MERKRYPTLELLRKDWIALLQGYSVFALIAGFIASLILALWRPSLYSYGFGVGLVISIALSIVHYYSFYALIRCPSCGLNLNRFKNGNRVPMKQAYTQLGNGYGCRHCGWKPVLVPNNSLELQ